MKSGSYEKGPFYYDENPLESVVVYVGCNPDICYCKKSPTVERDTRPRELKAVVDLCPANKMARCLCADKSVVKFPFDMSTFFFDCRPTKVSCNGWLFGYSFGQNSETKLHTLRDRLDSVVDNVVYI